MIFKFHLAILIIIVSVYIYLVGFTLNIFYIVFVHNWLVFSRYLSLCIMGWFSLDIYLCAYSVGAFWLEAPLCNTLSSPPASYRKRTLAHLHTCILAHLHTCTLAHLHTVQCTVNEMRMVLLLLNLINV